MTDRKTDLTRAARAAEQAAYAAGTHLQASRSRLSEIVITHQAPAEVVAAIDREARALIREVVLKHLPDHHFLGDGGHIDGPCWVVDPIDGRANYLRGYPQYAVSIALRRWPHRIGSPLSTAPRPWIAPKNTLRVGS